jgi:hypothetical protein
MRWAYPDWGTWLLFGSDLGLLKIEFGVPKIVARWDIEASLLTKLTPCNLIPHIVLVTLRRAEVESNICGSSFEAP